jgi:hypothetical protein
LLEVVEKPNPADLERLIEEEVEAVRAQQSAGENA